MRKIVALLAAVLCASLEISAAQEARVPHLTGSTVRVSVPEDTKIEAVGEGIVTLRSQNKLAFYDISRQHFFGGFSYMPVGGYSDKTVFSGGVCAVKTEETVNGSRATVYCILRPDGSKIRLKPEEFRKLGNFSDGLAPGKKATGAFSTAPAFVSAEGKPVLDAFTKGKTIYEDLKVRPISDGMRALFADSWGFATASGKIVVPATYKKAGNFSEGFALVAGASGKYAVIDKSGKAVVPESIDGGWQDPRDFHDGWAYLPAKGVFVDTKGNLSPEVEAVTDFFSGRALVKVGWNGFGIIDTSFGEPEPLKFESEPMLFKDSPTHFVGGYYLFDSYDYTYLIDSAGGLVMKTSGACHGTGLWEGPWITLWYDTEEGISYDHEAYAVCNVEGEIAVVFDCSGKFASIPEAKPRDVEVVSEDRVGPPIDPPVQEDDDDDQGSEGKKNIASKDGSGSASSVVEAVNVIFDEPYEGPRDAEVYSNVELGKPLRPGDTLRIAVLAEGEKDRVKTPLATIRSGGAAKTENMTPEGPGVFFSVLKAGKTSVEVHVSQEKDPSLDAKWMLEGRREINFNADQASGAEATVRIVTDPAGIPGTLFGDDLKGLFIMDFDQKHRITAYLNGNKEFPIPDFASYFWGPSRIEGFMEENGTKYIYMTGAVTAIGNWMDHGKDDDAGMLITLLVSLSDMNNEVTGGDPCYVVTTYPHRYRLSYTDLPDGGITLGLLERYSVGFGWVPSDDKRLVRKASKSYGFMTVQDSSEKPMDPDMLKGVQLHPVKKALELPSFYPGRNWFADDRQYEGAVKAFDRMYDAAGKGERLYTREECKAFVEKMIAVRGLKKLGSAR